MKLLRTERFARDYVGLPEKVRRQTERKLRYLAENLVHPFLRVKRVQRYRDVYEVSINRDHRMLFLIASGAYVLLRIGRHDIINRL